MADEFNTLQKLESFVGRSALLGEMNEWLKDGLFHLVFYNGDYGIGKTRLLQEILNQSGGPWHYPGAIQTVIDLYHTAYHSPEGLAGKIVSVQELSGNGRYFEYFYRARSALEGARASGSSIAAREHLNTMLDECVLGLVKLSHDKGLLLTFDTAERWIYPGGVSRTAPAWSWLLSWLGKVEKGVIAFAGRDPILTLYQQAKELDPKSIPLGFFDRVDTEAYFKAVVDRINLTDFRIDQSEIETLHSLSGGRPILLALFLELKLRNQIETTQFDHTGETFERTLIEYLINLPELGETLKAAGRAPKGVDPEILSMIRRINIRDAERMIENLKNLIFTKTFPGDPRVFLHDEMYVLLQKYEYSDERGADVVEAQEAANGIYAYYVQRIDQLEDELRKLIRLISTEQNGSRHKPQEATRLIRELMEPLQKLRIEFTYYRLRHRVTTKPNNRKANQKEDHIEAGLRRYYRFVHEAASSGDASILIPMQVELTNFEHSLPTDDYWKPFISGILIVHSVWNLVAQGLIYDEAANKAIEEVDEIRNLTAPQNAVLKAILSVWLGTYNVFRKGADFRIAESQFFSAIDSLKLAAEDPHLAWFHETVRSLAYRQLAYMYRAHGDFANAIANYLEGLKNSRAIDFYHEEATLRNDLGFAQLQIGLFQSAEENIQDGLRLRQIAANAPRLAQSYSTLARYYISTGEYQGAQRNARAAIRLSDAVGYLRGSALGNLALAEASRRIAFSPQGEPEQETAMEESRNAIESALTLFDQLDDGVSSMDAKLEQACIFRSRVRIERDPGYRRTWFSKADQLFKEVADTARAVANEYKEVDAMGNRIWLGNYMYDAENPEFNAAEAGHLGIDLSERASREFETLTALKPYWYIDGNFTDREVARRNPILWSEIGKYETARFIMAMNRWSRTRDDQYLGEAARRFVLSIFYSLEFARDHRGHREGRRTVLAELSKLNPEELARFSGAVNAAEAAEKIPSPSEAQKLMREHALWFGN